MSKAKKGKEAGKGPGTGGQRWDEQLIQESLDTDSWRLCICVIAGVDTCSEEFVTALAKQISSPNTEFKQRRKFYSLSFQEVIKKALEGSSAALSKSQASKGKGKGAASPAGALGNRPPGSEALADLVKSQSSSEEGVTADTVARAVKMSLLMLRQDDIVRRQQDAIREGRPGSGALTPSKKKGGKVTPTKGKQGKTGKGGVEEGIPMPTKPESTLRKRGEEVGETFFIDDEPTQGPEAYLLLSGVKNADVIAEMGRVGVAPSCLLRVSGGEKGVEEGEVEEEEKEKRNRSDESIIEFWNATDTVLETARDSGVRDTGIVLVDYTEDPEQERVQALYDQVAGHIYQLIEQKRLHKQYIDSLSLADITSNRVTTKNISESLYREQLHPVPNQCCSVGILMEALLQQVCESDVTQVPSTGDMGDCMSPALQESLNRIKQRPDIGSKFVSEKTISYPIIYEGDQICERESLFEATARALDKRGVENRMLDNYKAAQLLKKFPQLQQDERSRVDARYQQLFRLTAKSASPLSHNQLQSILLMLSFAEMVHSPSQQLFDDPYPDTNRQESVDSLTPVIANIQWSEPLTRDVISQRIQTVLSPDRGYPTCVTKYHKQSDKLLILFHPLSMRNEWKARILTPTGFYLYQRFLHSNISPLVDRVWQLNSSEREKLLGAQDLTPNPSQVSLTQISTHSGEKDKSKDGRVSSHSKNTVRASRSSRLKSSRVNSPSVERLRELEASGSREDLLAAQKSEIEQKLLLLTGYDLGDEWYAGRGSCSKIELSESEFLSSEQRSFYSTPHNSVTMQYSHESGVLAGISLLLDNTASNLTRDSIDDVITVLEPTHPLLYATYRVSLPTGVKLSLSPYGKLGGLPPPKQMLEDDEIRQLEEEHIRTPSPSMPPMTSESKLGGKGGRGKKTDDQLAVEQQRQLTEEREKRRREIEKLKEEKILKFKRENKYQTLFASTEYGLQVTCSSKVDLSSDVTIRDGSDGFLCVTQSYSNSPSPSQPCDKLRLYPASLETSRSYFEDGTVIRFMRNSSVQLFWPDGSSARSLCEGELELLNRNTPDLSTLTNISPPQTLTNMINHTEYSLSDKQWMYTDTHGQRFLYKWTQQDDEVEDTGEMGASREGQELELSTDKINKFSSFLYKDPLLKSWQRDPVSEEELVSREDQLITVLRKDGTRIVQFADGTRLTSSNTHSQIQIECAGYAKVRFSTPSAGQAVITLFDGNEIIADRRGTYSVISDDVICNFTQDGNSSVTLSNVSRVDMKLIGGDDWMTVKNERTHAINKQFKTYLCKQKSKKDDKSLPNKPIPRMFVLSRDGSGIELLSKEYAGKEVESWRNKEGVLLQSHALPGDSTVIVHSVISPITTPSHELSHLPYAEDNIVPTNLRSQYYIPLDLNKCKRDKGKVFGSGVGRGLEIGTVVRSTGNKREVPRAFRRRELLEHKPIGQGVMSAFVASLNGVNSWWNEIKKERDLFSPVEIRTDSVQEQAHDIFNRYNSIHTEDNDDKLIQEFTELVLSPSTQDIIHASSERKPERVQADRAELEEFQANLLALRTKDIPGYFHSEDGNKFLQNTPPDIQRLTEELPIAMRRGSHPQDTSQADITPPEPVVKSERLINPRLSELSQEAGQLGAGYASTTILLPENSASSVSLTARDRPDNPSPHIYTSADPSIVTTEESPIFSPSKLPLTETHTERPGKATPVGAGNEDTDNPIPEYLFYNVAGIPRTAPVKLPNSLKTLRPGDRECIDETKRQPNTASLSMPLSKSLKQGISLLETEVDFGMLEEGCIYSYTVHIKNTGIRSTRFKIKSPPISTGMKIIYTPHPIAAGMSASFQIEVYAVPVGVVGERGQGRVEHNLEIISEINTLILPVTATVLTTTSYQDEVGEHTQVKGVTLLPYNSTPREHKL